MILTGDCLSILPTLEAESVQCVVTSPPYYGLRNYGVEGQIGLERNYIEYVEKLVRVFREVWRVLRPDGTLWLNLGDSYASGKGTCFNPGGNTSSFNVHLKEANVHPLDRGNKSTLEAVGLKPKDLIGIPWLVAKALQAPYYTGRIKSERDRVYLAATIDAEGTICGFTHKRKDNGDIRRGIHVTVTNSNIRMLDECYRIWATSKQDHNAHGKGHLGKLDTFRWIAHDLSEKQQLLAELYPYFICKQKQALLAWNFFEISKQARGRNKGAEGDENREKSAWVVHALSRLNHLEPVDIPAWIKEPPSQLEPGWWLRQDIIWAKPNPMPESVTDRCTKAHEYIFLLTKSARYFYDAEAVKEDAAQSSLLRWNQNIEDQAGSYRVPGKTNEPMKAVGGSRSARDSFKRENSKRAEVFPGQSMGTHRPDREESAWDLTTRNRRSVWTITTKPFKEAHFATFPPEIPEICIKAGTSEKGCCPECGSPWERVVAKEGTGKVYERGKCQADHRAIGAAQHTGSGSGALSVITTTTGWRPTCTHNLDPVPCTVLDPFSGAGTTGLVAEKLGRKYIGIELKLEYVEISEKRIFNELGGLF